MIRPLKDNVILKLLPLEQMTASGLHVVRSSDPKAKASRWARVIASGPGYHRQVPCKLGDRRYTEETSVFVPNETKPGDLVLVDEICGDEYMLDVSIPRVNVGTEFSDMIGERGKFRIVREDEIHLIAEEAQAAE